MMPDHVDKKMIEKMEEADTKLTQDPQFLEKHQQSAKFIEVFVKKFVQEIKAVDEFYQFEVTLLVQKLAKIQA